MERARVYDQACVHIIYIYIVGEDGNFEPNAACVCNPRPRDGLVFSFFSFFFFFCCRPSLTRDVLSVPASSCVPPRVNDANDITREPLPSRKHGVTTPTPASKMRARKKKKKRDWAEKVGDVAGRTVYIKLASRVTEHSRVMLDLRPQTAGVDPRCMQDSCVCSNGTVSSREPLGPPCERHDCLQTLCVCVLMPP